MSAQLVLVFLRPSELVLSGGVMIALNTNAPLRSAF
jgi:hypothetical protein